MADHVTLRPSMRPSMYASRRQRAERGAKQNFSSPNPTCSLSGALISRGVWLWRPLAHNLPRPVAATERIFLSIASRGRCAGSPDELWYH